MQEPFKPHRRQMQDTFIQSLQRGAEERAPATVLQNAALFEDGLMPTCGKTTGRIGVVYLHTDVFLQADICLFIVL